MSGSRGKLRRDLKFGFAMRLRKLNYWLLARLAAGYVELIRNVPLLLQLLFWYNAVLKALPDLRESWTLPGSIFLNNRVKISLLSIAYSACSREMFHSCAGRK